MGLWEDITRWVWDRLDDLQDWVWRVHDDLQDWVSRRLDDVKDWVRNQGYVASGWVWDRINGVKSWVLGWGYATAAWVNQQWAGFTAWINQQWADFQAWVLSLLPDTIPQWIYDPVGYLSGRLLEIFAQALGLPPTTWWDIVSHLVGGWITSVITPWLQDFEEGYDEGFASIPDEW